MTKSEAICEISEITADDSHDTDFTPDNYWIVISLRKAIISLGEIIIRDRSKTNSIQMSLLNLIIRLFDPVCSISIDPYISMVNNYEVDCLHSSFKVTEIDRLMKSQVTTHDAQNPLHNHDLRLATN